jgi:outer membrane protein assembly factor BamB
MTATATVSERWRTALPVGVVGLPVADEMGIVVTAGESEVVALTNTGTVSWTTAVAGALVNPPRLDGNLVLVAAKRAVVALWRDSGAVAWTSPTALDGEPDNRANRPVVVGDVVVVTVASGAASGLDRTTGAPRWSVDLPTAITSEPASGGDVAVLVGIGAWWALDAATGAVLWSGDLGTFGTSSPVMYGDAGRMLAAVASDARVTAVDARTGEVQWTAVADQSELYQVPLATPSHELLVPDHWGRMTAYNAHDGEVLWRVRGADGVAEFGTPVVLAARTVALSLDDAGPRIASPGGSTALPTPASGHGVTALADGGLVVTTWGAPVNYVLAYDVIAPNR